MGCLLRVFPASRQGKNKTDAKTFGVKGQDYQTPENRYVSTEFRPLVVLPVASKTQPALATHQFRLLTADRGVYQHLKDKTCLMFTLSK
jgi:hypothetical protein